MANKTLFGVAWYKPEQWARLLGISVDSEDLEPTYAEWVSVAQQKILELEKQGVFLRRVQVDVEKLLAWCESEGRPVDATARSEYTTYRLRQEDLGLDENEDG